MVELWFYSGRLGNCMFMYSFTRLLAHLLDIPCSVPKGTEIQSFPLIKNLSKKAEKHDDKFIIGDSSRINPKTVINENDNMNWFLENTFQGKTIESYSDMITLQKILDTPNVHKQWNVLLGNFELGKNYYPYKELIKSWFKFPEIIPKSFEYFKLHKDYGKNNWFEHVEYKDIDSRDLLISLRLEDYTNEYNKDRLLDFSYFKIILQNFKFKNLYIITNPSSIGHNDQYKYLLDFKDYDPTFIRINNPVEALALGTRFNHIAISQSTYSWWVGFLSEASTVFYPISKKGPFSLTDSKYRGTDLRVPLSNFLYVDQDKQAILDSDYYKKIDYEKGRWKD